MSEPSAIRVAVVQDAPVAYLSLSAKGHILETNAAAEIMLKSSQQVLRGEIFFNFLPEAQRPNDELLFRELLQRGGPPVDTERTLMLEGEEKTVTVHVIPVAESAHDPTRFRVVLFDVTERRRIESRALFVFIGAEPFTRWLGDELALDEKGFVLTGPAAARAAGLGRDCLLLETSLPGVLAAGDVRSGSIKRVASAVGEGSMAVRLVHERLSSLGHRPGQT